MTEYPLLLDAAGLRALRTGAKTQTRLLASSPLSACQPGDRLWVKEGCAGVQKVAGGQELSAKIGNADFVAFADGWRQYRDGSGHPGPPPTGSRIVWTPAIHMPRWACRTLLIVEHVEIRPLQSIGREDLRAEGGFMAAAGLFWRWRAPVRGIWRDPRGAFAALWNVTHGTAGERWEDNPAVVVLTFSHASLFASASH